ncbi:hypothetical protein TREMEDRAFT_18134, partial [Tremella mesenterica DSM 1558]|uniref:uncharacterized protein n=1 Tax=Tremella mesenterica (strain ATCC 24925 / CBS 8224 / DSM 1558 / NBRC 9311 / NRRL Y-6157 / RJB 2259-6 / UBC 559-6) TaxID=578456 RepID=UPI0003F48EB4
KNALIVTAHPDDEAMFFSPTILALTRNGWNVSGLCLSNGNAEGLGKQREKELYASYNRLGVPSSKVEIINDPALQDGMQRAWMPSDTGKYVYRRLDTEPFSVVIKFDKYGISGHINHRAASLACSPVNWPFLITTRKLKVWAVKTPSLLEKYMGPFPAIYHLVHTRIADTEKVEVINGLERWWTGIEAMREHKTQLVWFRWIWLGVGSLQWTNTL